MDRRDRSLSRRLQGVLAAQGLDRRRHDQDFFAYRFARTLPNFTRAGTHISRDRLRRAEQHQQSRIELRCGPYVERLPYRTAHVDLFLGHLELYMATAEAGKVSDRRAGHRHEGTTSDRRNRPTPTSRRQWLSHDYFGSGADLEPPTLKFVAMSVCRVGVLSAFSDLAEAAGIHRGRDGKESGIRISRGDTPRD